MARKNNNDANDANPPNDINRKKEKLEKLSETLQYIGILGAIVMGLKQPPKQGETVIGDKEVPNWLLSAFPSLTDEDEVEYNLILSSLNQPEKIALKEFEEKLKREGIYDEVKFRVLLVKIRREFIEKIKSPVPENKSTTLKFGALQLNDAITDFASLLNAEKVQNRTPKDIFENQKLIADNLKLLNKKHLIKKLASNKTATLLWFLFILLGLLTLLKEIFS